MELRVGSVSDRGLSHKRPVNEDRALVRLDRGLFVVCDGVGGHNRGEVASQLAIDTIEEAVDHAPPGSMEDVLRDAVRYANRDIYEMATGNAEFDGMGTTVALLHLDLDRQSATIGHAGDSRVYRYNGGRLHRETYDHTDLDDAIRAGRLSQADALSRGKQNTINRALGIDDEVEAEFKAIPIGDGDAYLLCSDGVTRHIDDEELEDLFGQGLDPESFVDEIRNRCYARGAEDNLTAVVVYTTSPESVAAGSERGSRRWIEIPTASTTGPASTGRLTTPRRTSRALPVVAALALGAIGFVAGFFWKSWVVPAPPPIPPEVAARQAFDRGEYAAAREGFAGLVGQHPTRAEYQYWLARAEMADGQTALAIEHFEGALSRDATLLDAYIFLAAAYQLEKRPDEASDALRRYREQIAARPRMGGRDNGNRPQNPANANRNSS